MDESDRAAAGHFRGIVAEDGHRARADLDEISGAIGHEDEVLRGFENALPLFDFLVQRLLRPLAVGDVARDLRGPDDPARRRADRRNAERNFDRSAVLVEAQGLEMFDLLAPADPIEDGAELRAPVRRNDDVDGLADGFRRGISEQLFGGPVPAGDGAVERLGDDGVIG